MKNFSLSNYTHQVLNENNHASFCYFDESSNTIYLLDTEKNLLAYKLSSQFIPKLILKFDLSADLLPDSEIVDLHYIIENDSIVIVTHNGDIFRYEVSKQNITLEGTIESGITAASWSPSQENLIICSGNKSIILFDVNFEVKNEVPIDDIESDEDIIDPKIIWKSDAKFFSINFGNKEKGRKVLTRNLHLEIFKSPAKSDEYVKSITEKPTLNLSSVFSWQPNGSLTVGSVETEKSSKLIFWEKNGLLHGEFALPDLMGTSFKISRMAWSKDSEILALQASCENENYLLFLHRSNYRWYIKRAFPTKKSKILQFYFIDYSFLVFYDNFEMEIFYFLFDCSIAYKDSLGLYCNEDLTHIDVTFFGKNVIPPPMSNCVVNTGIRECIYWRKNEMISVSEKQITLFIFENNQIHSHSIDFPSSERQRLRHCLLVDNNCLIVVYNVNSEVFLEEIMLEKIGNQLNIKNSRIHKVFHNIVAVSPGLNEKEIFVQYEKGAVYKFILGMEEFSFENFAEFPMVCPNFVVKKMNEEIHSFGLSLNHRLYIDSKLISTECTSFGFYDDILLFTATSQGLFHLLYIFDFSMKNSIFYNGSENLTTYLPKTDSKSYNIRNIERGSRLVSVLSDKIILQLPRGNLETVYPKILLLKKFKDLWFSKEYKKAFEILRQNKLDLNVVFDIDPEFFIANNNDIVKGLEKPDYINLLLSSLSNTYSEAMEYILQAEEIKKIKDFLSKQNLMDKNWKINIICQKIREGLENLKNENYIFSILTTYIKKVPSELDYTLQIIRKMKDEQKNEPIQIIPPHIGEKKAKKSHNIKANDLLEYVCWLADPEKMYEVALATCDLDLVAIVATQTQKDPKEYLPYLESIKKIMDITERRVKIFLDLKHYDKAIIELSQNQTEENIKLALNLIKSHQLYKLGLSVFKKFPVVLMQVQELLGDNLLSKKDFYQAARMFLNANNFDKALISYRSEGNYEEALKIAKKMNYENDRIQNLKLDFIEILSGMGKNSTLGSLYRDLGKEIDALNSFFKANDYGSILETYQLSNNKEGIINNALSGLKLAQNIKINGLKSQKSEFHARLERLRFVQTEKKNRPLIAHGGGMQPDDALSEASFASKSSYMSVKSLGGTSRKQKKPTSTRRNLKEGSLREEEALVEVLLSSKMTREHLTEIESLVEALVSFNEPELAEELYVEARTFAEMTNIQIKTLQQEEIEGKQPEMFEIYPGLKQNVKNQKEMDGLFGKFDYLLKG